jgi:hypothetical protein
MREKTRQHIPYTFTASHGYTGHRDIEIFPLLKYPKTLFGRGNELQVSGVVEDNQENTPN